MANNDTIIRFDDVTFNYGLRKPILDEVSFNIRRGSKITLMGQNGAGKSTLFGLITGTNTPESGSVIIEKGLTIALSRQVIPRSELNYTVREFFQHAFTRPVYDIDPRIDEVLEAVNLHAPYDKRISAFSGGQQARLLLAHALIQNPQLLLLDEPTNNLDKAGIEHLTAFIKAHDQTVIVISHDAHFLNSFTDGVLYLDVFTKKIEQFVGNYNDVQEQIQLKMESDNRKNAQLQKHIQENKDKSNFFANKGGQMRLVAKRMREKAEEMEEEMVDIRKEDKTIAPFTIPVQQDLSGELLNITSLRVIHNHEAIEQAVKVSLRKNRHLLLSGPNGIGKTTLLESIAHKTALGVTMAANLKIGYYRQDFSNLDFEKTVLEELLGVMDKQYEHEARSVAARFLITGELANTKIGYLSEGQKGLVAFARLVLLKPGLLILDEPTNHINFRHIPVIAEALHDYEGAMILVSHVPDFVAQVRIDERLDLGALAAAYVPPKKRKK